MLRYHDRDIEDPWLRARLAALPGGTAILDVGCLEGWVLEEYPEARGIDARQPPDSWAARVWVGDAAELPVATGTVGAVSCVSVLEHVGLGFYGDPVADEDSGGAAEKVRSVLAEIARILAPGGWAFVTVPLGLAASMYGRPFSRPLVGRDITLPLEQGGLRVEEYLEVAGHTWVAAPDASGSVRRLLLLSARKAPY